MKKFGSKQLIPLFAAAVAILFIVMGIGKYGFWDEVKGPTRGFVPIIVATALLIVSIFAFKQSFSEEQPRFPWQNYLVILAGAGIFAATFLIGMLPALGLFVILWLRVLEKTPWKTTLIVFFVIMAIVYGAFVLWLKVPFPEGLLFETILS